MKPNCQMESMVKMTKKDQGERGMGKRRRYSHPIENRMWSLTACNVTKGAVRARGLHSFTPTPHPHPPRISHLASVDAKQNVY